MPEISDEERKIYAEASQESYGNLPFLTEDIYGNKTEWQDLLLLPINNTGFSAKAYQNTDTGEIIIAYTGTNNLPDWVPNNIGIALDIVPDQYAGALAFYDMIQHDYPGATISVTGQSLGGALAQLVGAATGADAVTFNSPGVAHLLNDLGLSTSDEYSNITNYSLGNDILNTLNIAGGFKKIGSNYIIPSTEDNPVVAHNDLASLANHTAIPQNEFF